jgi:pimeloyl-ACP methyl ester carboxylesterase
MTDGGRTSSDVPGWPGHPDAIAPTVLILGGFLTAPSMYSRLVRRLKVRGAAAVVVANVWTPDWLLASVLGTGPIATRSARALLAAGRVGRDLSEGAPLIVVGHSAGGIVARLLTAPEPFAGRRFAAAPRIGAIVTLGTPHRVSSGEGIGRRINEVASSIADELVPGAFFAPEVGYVSVGSRAIRGHPKGTGRERVAHLLYRSVIGRAAVPGTEGDGLVPVVATTLNGARQLVLDRAFHGPGSGGPWYGTDDEVDVWWPVALQAWREALSCRTNSAGAGVPRRRSQAAATGTRSSVSSVR